MKKILAFITSKTFFANLALVLVFFAILIWMTKSWLKATTHHGEQIIVPELYSTSLADAERLLAERNLQFRIIDSAEFDPKMPLGSVLEQYPKAGDAVKSERVILLTINPFTVRKIEIPNIIDKTLRRAIYDLESKGFVVGELIYKPDIAKDVVLGMLTNEDEVQPGDKFMKGTTVRLIVGSGLGDERTPVPYLKWLTLEKAEEKLLAHSLNLGLVLYDEEIQDTAAALVYKQLPIPSHEPKLRLGTTIDIWLTNDSTKVPNDSLAFQYLHKDLDSINPNFDHDTITE
jgi:beta-lactam-binding protein with PASTA domain